MVRGLLGPLRPSRCLPELSTTKSSVIPNFYNEKEKNDIFLVTKSISCSTPLLLNTAELSDVIYLVVHLVTFREVKNLEP